MSKTHQNPKSTSPACSCCIIPLDRTIHRRRFLSLAVGGAMAGLLIQPRQLLAETGVKTYDAKTYDTMVLSCIDPRMQKHVAEFVESYLKKEKLNSEYSQVTIAGAAIGAVAPGFKDWHQTFWDNLAITLALHQIVRVLVINHRECGAATEAYRPHRNGDGEERLHQRVMEDLREQIHKRHPQLCVENFLMDIGGKTKRLPPLKLGCGQLTE